MPTATTAARVLVVEDEDNITFLLSTALRHFGFAVDTAADGRSALQLARGGGQDVILLDVMLPDLDGFEVCRRLRGDGVDTPVLFLTARDGTEDTVRGLTLGGDDYVTKPFALEEIVARVQALLRRCGPLLDVDAFTEPTSVRDVAADLEVSEAAVKQHLAQLYVKFALSGASRPRVRLANVAVRSGAVTLEQLRKWRSRREGPLG